MHFNILKTSAPLAIFLFLLPIVTSAGVDDNTKVWGWIGSTTNLDADQELDADDDPVGWLNTNCYTSYYQNLINDCTPDYGVNIDFRTGLVEGNAWIGTADPETGDNAIGFITFNYDPVNVGEDPDPTDEFPLEVQGEKFMARVIETKENDKTVFKFYGWGRIMSLKEEGEKLHGLYDPTGADWQWGWVKLSDDTRDYGLYFLPDNRVVKGEAWSGGGSVGPNNVSDVATGLGFISGSIGGVNFPYFKTDFGDIYARERFGSVRTIGAPGGDVEQYTATYLILSSGNVRAAVPNPDTGDIIAESDLGYTIGFPQVKNRFTNILGKLPIAGADTTRPLTKIINQSGKQNVYGEVVSSTSQTKTSKIFNGGTTRLNGGVLEVRGSLTVDEPLKFLNGVQNNPNQGRGDGVIYVRGDLIVNYPMEYETLNSLGGDIERVASVVWIVEGDVIVHEDLDKDQLKATDMVGTFFVVGDPDIAESGDFHVKTIDLERYRDGERDVPFQLEGLVVAKEFVLERQFINEFSKQDPAENFVFDGRFLVNPPRSMQAVSDALPTLTSTTP